MVALEKMLDPAVRRRKVGVVLEGTARAVEGEGLPGEARGVGRAEQSAVRVVLAVEGVAVRRPQAPSGRCRRAATLDGNAVVAVAGDLVAADRGRGVRYVHAAALVGQGIRASQIGADAVVLDGDARRGSLHEDAIPVASSRIVITRGNADRLAARNHIASPRRQAADLSV